MVLFLDLITESDSVQVHKVFLTTSWKHGVQQGGSVNDVLVVLVAKVSGCLVGGGKVDPHSWSDFSGRPELPTTSAFPAR